MLAVHASADGSIKAQVNILPCRIHRNGRSKVTKRFWSPTTEKDAGKTAYFRGRKLRGRQINLPKDYHGVAVIKTDQVLPPTSKQGQTTHRRQSEDDEDDEDMSEEEVQADPVKILKEEAKFDMVTVWGHDRLPAADDNFIKGIEEWIAFAEAIHTGKTDIPQSSDSAPC